MRQKANILIVDDHPFIIEAYKNAIKGYNADDYLFNITQASDCKSGYEKITQADKDGFDIAFLDISMPAYEEKQIYSGEDLARLIRDKMPECKVILLTMHTELLKISSILKNVTPNGLIIKNDLTFDELLIAFDKILHGQNYYSQTVEKLIGQIEADPVDIDQFDKQILYHLSKGVKTKDIPSFVPLSLSAVEKRKLNLKERFNLRGGADIELIRLAKEKGML